MLISSTPATPSPPSNLPLALQPRMQPSHRRRFLIHKRLHPKADAIHPLPQQLGQRLVRKLPRRTLQRNLSVVSNVELTTQFLKDQPKLRARQQARSSTAKVNSVHRPSQTRSNPLRRYSRRVNLHTHARDIMLHPISRKHPRGKVAESTLGLAEWNRDVDAGRSSHVRETSSLQLFHGDSFPRPNRSPGPRI